MATKENEVPLPVAAAAVEKAGLPDVNEGAVLNSINEKFIGDYQETKSEKPCTIYKVRERIRRDDPEAYTPQVISIGPFHHDNELLLQTERLKRKFLGDLIKRHPSNTLAKYIKDLSGPAVVTNASSCYSEKVVSSDSSMNAFVEMMVLDGCFIIEFLVKSFSGESMGEVDFVNWNRSLIENDLLMLENQIPFSVLQLLYKSSTIPTINDGDNPVTLKELASSCISRDRLENVQPIPDVVHHLLHLRLASLVPGCHETSHGGATKPRSCIFKKWRPDPPEPNHRVPRMTPSATELHNAGVKFQMKKKSGGILDVTFRSKEGIMEIPLITVQAVTVSQFRNLVAFEQCYPSAGSHFTSYVALMDNLIDIPADVALLERSGVLESKLSCDEEVCRFFNSLGKGAFLDYENHYLVGLFKDVNDYCSK